MEYQTRSELLAEAGLVMIEAFCSFSFACISKEDKEKMTTAGDLHPAMFG